MRLANRPVAGGQTRLYDLAFRFPCVADAQLRSNVRESNRLSTGWARALTAAIVAVKVAVGDTV
jgi:hypothetical protein